MCVGVVAAGCGGCRGCAGRDVARGERIQGGATPLLLLGGWVCAGHGGERMHHWGAGVGGILAATGCCSTAVCVRSGWEAERQ